MITVPPAAAQVASITIDGIALPASWSHGSGPDAEPAEDGVEDAGRAASKKNRHNRTETTGGMTTGR